MRNEEVIELQELRKEKELQSKKVQSLQFEMEDNDMAMRSLESWKKFRWVGFFLAVQAFFITLVLAYFHLKSIEDTDPGLYENFGDTIISSISTVSVAFALMVLAVLAILCIVMGLKLFMELGESDAARLMAKARFKKNYHTEKEKLQKRYCREAYMKKK